jgi:thiamine-monophosphate kinase
MPPERRRGTGVSLRERPFHRWLATTLTGSGRGLLPVGDDTAAVPIGGGRVALLTSDALTEGTHFRADSPPRSIGHAAAAVNLSDIAAKGGRPVAFLLDLLLPSGTPERWAREVTLGAEEMLARFGAHLVGGDTKPALGRAVVGSLFGVGRADRLAPRSAARPGDLLVVTGAVGRGGYDALAVEGARRPSRRDLARWLEVRPRVFEGAELACFAHAMMDTSDGLADSVHLLAEASRRRIVVRADDLPIYPALTRRFDRARLRVAFFGGDYELLATLPREDLSSARRALARLGCPLTVVGRVETGDGAWLESDRGVRALPRAGWRPFERGRLGPH